MVLNASLLLERARVDELVAGVEQLGRELEQRIQLRAVGPLPPYSFVELPDVSREGAWA
jgi:hypothetical protein